MVTPRSYGYDDGCLNRIVKVLKTYRILRPNARDELALYNYMTLIFESSLNPDSFLLQLRKNFI